MACQGRQRQKGTNYVTKTNCVDISGSTVGEGMTINNGGSKNSGAGACLFCASWLIRIADRWNRYVSHSQDDSPSTFSTSPDVLGWLVCVIWRHPGSTAK